VLARALDQNLQALRISQLFNITLAASVLRPRMRGHQMARMTVRPFKEGWLELATE
jgi:hypothetical protein